MGRHLSKITSRGPEATLACGLRHVSAGYKLRELSALTGLSNATLSKARSGKVWPTLQVVRVIVSACGADVAHWERTWHQGQEERRELSRRPGVDQESGGAGRDGVAGSSVAETFFATAAPDESCDFTEFKQLLITVRVRAGQPSLRELERRSGEHDVILPRSTVSGFLAPRSQRLPTRAVLLAYLTVLGVQSSELGAWVRVWERLMIERLGGGVSPSRHLRVAA